VSRNLIVFLVGLLIIPGAILGGSIALESGQAPVECQHRDVWLRDSTTRFAAAEGVAGSVQRYYGGDSQLKTVVDAYNKAAAEQKASNPPAADAQSNDLVVQYYQWMSENWNGWIAQPYISVHSDLDLKAQAENVHQAFLASKDHCA
jgi:hypothetical protein